MKIVFFGTPEFTVSNLEALHKHPEIQVIAAITQPDKKVGRKQLLTAPPVKLAAQRLNIPTFQPKSKEELEEVTAKLEADFFVVIAYGMILSKKVLGKPKIACINIHYSLLPKYRGASPIQAALLNGDLETGIAIMKMEEKLDAGPIYKLQKLPIKKTDNYQSLHEKLAELGTKVLPETLLEIRNGLETVGQDHSLASFCGKISKEEGEINWSKPAEEINNMIRAYSLWPQTYCYLQNSKKLKIIEAEVEEGNLEEGQFQILKNKLQIGTSKGVLAPTLVQPEGKAPMNIQAFVNGYKDQLK